MVIPNCLAHNWLSMVLVLCGLTLVSVGASLVDVLAYDGARLWFGTSSIGLSYSMLV